MHESPPLCGSLSLLHPAQRACDPAVDCPLKHIVQCGGRRAEPAMDVEACSRRIPRRAGCLRRASRAPSSPPPALASYCIASLARLSNQPACAFSGAALCHHPLVEAPFAKEADRARLVLPRLRRRRRLHIVHDEALPQRHHRLPLTLRVAPTLPERAGIHPRFKLLREYLHCFEVHRAAHPRRCLNTQNSLIRKAAHYSSLNSKCSSGIQA
jgi:hypothetical protein